MSGAVAPVRARMLLDLADRADHGSPLERALAVAEQAGEDAPSLRDAPLGRLNATLIGYHAALAGPLLEAVTTCPSCLAVVEFALDADELRSLAPDAAATGGFGTDDGYLVHWRVPTAADLAAVADERAPASGLLARCARATLDEMPVDVADLPAELVERIEAELAAADPLAEVSVGLTCPDCATAFDADLDPAAFVWTEIETGAHRVLIEIDALARAYGWTESEVLALPEARRHAYLEIVREGG